MVRVRTAKAEDVPVITEVTVRGWQFAFRGLFPDDYLAGLNPKNREPSFAERVNGGPSYHTAVAVDANEVIGFVGLAPPDAEELDATAVHEIWGLYVEPDRYGTGVGRTLIEHALDYLRAGGWDYAILWTLRDVARTCHFYETGGWYRDGEEKVWELPEGNPVTLVRYRFDLSH